MGISREPTNIIRNCVMVICPGETKFISMNDVVFLMPIWKQSPCGYWVDATGTYDLCMDEAQLRYRISTCEPVCTTYMYRFIPGNWFAKRQGFQRP